MTSRRVSRTSAESLSERAWHRQCGPTLCCCGRAVSAVLVQLFSWPAAGQHVIRHNGSTNEQPTRTIQDQPQSEPLGPGGGPRCSGCGRALQPVHLVLVLGRCFGNHGFVSCGNYTRLHDQLLEKQTRVITNGQRHAALAGIAMIAATDGGAMVPRICFAQTALVLAITGLVACSTGPRRETYWVNPRFGPELQQQRFTLDSTECVALANQLIPEPSPPPPPPQPQTGSITLYTPRGPVSGSYQSDPPAPQGYQPSEFSGGYESVLRARNRRSYAAACMGNRGWQQRERIVGQ